LRFGFNTNEKSTHTNKHTKTAVKGISYPPTDPREWGKARLPVQYAKSSKRKQVRRRKPERLRVPEPLPNENEGRCEDGGWIEGKCQKHHVG